MDKRLEMELRKRETAEDYAEKKRGEFINSAIDVENILSEVIAWCFYPSRYSRHEVISELVDQKGLELKSLLLRKIDFRDKIELLKDTLTVKKPQILQSNRSLVRLIIRELDGVRKFRNLLAHSESDLSTEFVNGAVNYDKELPIDSLQVIELKNGKMVKHLIGREEYVSQWMAMHRVWVRLHQLFALLNDDYEQAKNYETWVANFS